MGRDSEAWKMWCLLSCFLNRTVDSHPWRQNYELMIDVSDFLYIAFGSSAGEASASLVAVVEIGARIALMLGPRAHSDDSNTLSTLDSSDVASTSDPGPLEETAARGSGDFPCRAFYPLTHPRDGHVPHDEALSSGEFPAKPAITEWGVWMRWGPGCVFALQIHYSFLNEWCICLLGVPFLPLTSCYCVDKLHRCFHYDVDDNFCLHANSRCSENVDINTGWIWPVVVMCRWCCPFLRGHSRLSESVLGRCGFTNVFYCCPCLLAKCICMLRCELTTSLAYAGEASTSFIYSVWTTSCVNLKGFLAMSWCGSTPTLLDDCGRCRPQKYNSSVRNLR